MGQLANPVTEWGKAEETASPQGGGGKASAGDG